MFFCIYTAHKNRIKFKLENYVDVDRNALVVSIGNEEDLNKNLPTIGSKKLDHLITIRILILAIKPSSFEESS